MSKKPRVGVDVDGVLADLATPLLALMNSLYGTNHKPDSMERWDIEHLIPEGEVADFWARVGTPGFVHDQMQPYPGAVDGVRALSEIADVYVVTSYLHDAPTWVHERDAWIDRHFGIPRHKMVHTKAKYTFTGRMLIDDKPQNIEEWSVEHPRGCPVLWAQPYNNPFVYQPSPDVIRTKSWRRVLKLVGTL